MKGQDAPRAPIPGHIGKRIKEKIERGQQRLADHIGGHVGKLSFRQQKVGLLIFTIGSSLLLALMILGPIKNKRRIDVGTISPPQLMDRPADSTFGVPPWPADK